ncbi:NTP transferase domain-containing protein [Desulfobacter curvatus]|uniref:phosphocholine cytidylyltransferase family protein n=1 Tax=Desulfobacter curvatus TaxID=2290 RepID=UPI0003629C28|nr:NTP transferase domain-containing protein [Desulfobacter curvatus]
MKAIILAAGRGKRLEKYTKGLPKCLLKLGNETVLSREIRLLQEAGISKENIYVVGGYKYELLLDDSPNMIINELFDVKDNAYSLGLALESVCDENVIILDGDLCFEQELLLQIINCPHKNVLLSKLSEDLHESTGIKISDNNVVTAIGKQYKNTGYVYISIFKIAKEIIVDFRKNLLEDRNSKTWYTSALTKLCNNHKFYNLVTNCKWHEIDFIEDYVETKQIFNLH